MCWRSATFLLPIAFFAVGNRNYNWIRKKWLAIILRSLYCLLGCLSLQEFFSAWFNSLFDLFSRKLYAIFQGLYLKKDAQNHYFATASDKRIVFPIAKDRVFDGLFDRQSFKTITINVVMVKKVIANGFFNIAQYTVLLIRKTIKKELLLHSTIWMSSKWLALRFCPLRRDWKNKDLLWIRICELKDLQHVCTVYGYAPQLVKRPQWQNEGL